MRKRRFRLGRTVLLLLVLGGIAIALRQGLIPSTFVPLPTVNLDNPTALLIDWRLAALRKDPQACARVLVPPHIEATAVRDNPLRNGCGWENAVRMSSAGNARIHIDKVSCEAAAAFALWMAHEVQPLAVSMLGKRVTSVQHMGTYSCRNIVGNRFWKDMRSEHATANAIDIAGFTLEDGRQISVLRDWEDKGADAEFLRAVHSRACRYFRVALGPEFNPAHRDHFHFDRGPLSTCR
jgi:hypothetical protein